ETEFWLKVLPRELQKDDSSLRRVSSLPIKRTFVYIDVSDFSQHRSGQQGLIINSLNSIVRKEEYWSAALARHSRQGLEAQLCIGDGYIFVFKDSMNATYFAACLAQLIEVLVAHNQLPVIFHFRMGVHVGLVHCFWDWGRDNWNYIGDGINGGQRVLATIK